MKIELRAVAATATIISFSSLCYPLSSFCQEEDGNLTNSPKRLAETVVESVPLEPTTLESAQPVTVLSREQILSRAHSTLGEMLSSEPGVSGSSFGPGASRPIIRGLGGDRVRILENGIGTQDVSNVSPDHAVTLEPATAKKIEIVRGPAALLYGTSAVGGVVNVFDDRIPEELPKAPLEGSAEVRGGTVDRERTGVFSASAPAGQFAFHLGGAARRSNNIFIPGYARTEALRSDDPPEDGNDPRRRLPSSGVDSVNGNFGSSYIGDSGFLGASISRLMTNYGVPTGEPDAQIDAERDRIDVHGKVYDPSEAISSMEFKLGAVDYDHTEYANDEAGTHFTNRGLEARYEVTHKKIGAVEGVVGLQYIYGDLTATGEEAFQPPTISNTSSAFLFEELGMSDAWKLQMGGRFDYASVNPNPTSSETNAPTAEKIFPTLSQSVGLVWIPQTDYSVTLSVAHTERAPSGQELFADGPHVATGTYEIGDPDLAAERSWGYDLTFRKDEGRVTGSLGLFYNRFSNYIGQVPTGQVIEEGLTTYQFEAMRADFYGAESRVAYHLLGVAHAPEDLSIDIQPDYVYAEDRDTDQPLPRIAPLRIRSGINYELAGVISTRFEVQHVFRQDRTAPGETETPQYTMVNAYVTKPITLRGYAAEVFIRGTNLLSQKARESTSFLKDVAPLPEAGASAGIQFKF